MAVVGTPATLAGLGATGIRRITYDKKLREDSIRPSVFTVLKTALSVDKNIVNVSKVGVFMTVDSAGNGGLGQSSRVAMRLPLQEAPQMGTAETILGNEEGFRLLYTDAYYNEVKKGVKTWNWGYNFNDTAYLNVNNAVDPAISEFMAELRDLRIHQALCLRRSEELTKTPTSLTQTVNPNIIVPNLDDASFPAWDKDAPTVTEGAVDSLGYYSARTYSGSTTYAELVAAAILAGSGTGATSKCKFNVDTIFMSEEYNRQVIMGEQVMVDGQWTTIILVPSRVKAWMLNPNNAGSLGEYMKSVADYKDPNRPMIPYEFGRVGSLLFVEDMRAPTLTIGGAAGSYTLKFGFVCPGNNDDRNNSAWSNSSGSTNYVFDICTLLNANAVLEYIMDPLNTKLRESTEYEQVIGRAAYLGEGLQLPFWDKDTGSQADGASKTLIYRGSALIPIGRTSRTTVV
jgi:hypothetical protein